MKSDLTQFSKYYDQQMSCFNNKTAGDNAPVPDWGPGRVDAFGAIFNRASDFNLNNSSNHRPANAPVSFPFLWNIHLQDHVQWFAGVPNVNFVDQLGRNAGEVVGVFARIDVDPKKLWYPSTIKTKNLLLLEYWLHQLRAPQWPDKLLGPIDTDKKNLGAKLYADNCSKNSCHPMLDGSGKQVKIVPIDITKLQTDSTTVDNIFNAQRNSGILYEVRQVPFLPARFPAQTTAPALAANEGAFGIFSDFIPGWISPPGWFDNAAPWNSLLKKLTGFEKQNTSSTENLATDSHTNAPDLQKGYEARPLNGIWASPPYLHNGSVPSLYQLLLPPAQRLNEFYVGTHEYDTVNVGYQTDASYGGKKYDTSLKGNYNTGHDYGTKLSDPERWALVEYMKSL